VRGGELRGKLRPARVTILPVQIEAVQAGSTRRPDEWTDHHRAAIVELVKELKAAGCRIDAVGSQAHMHMNSPTLEATETSIKKLKAAGVKVLITEWDISILPSPYEGANISANFKYSEKMDPYRESIPDSVQQKWDKRVLDMFELFLKYSDVVDRVTVWGLSDNTTWLNNFPIRGRKDYPVLFDRNNQRKPVVEEMIKMAKKQ
jgi:endo-1,4-beta-xylanase